MKNLLHGTKSARRQHQLNPGVTTLEDRKLLATGAGALPTVNLSPATITALGQQLANLAQRFDGHNALQDLTQTATAIGNDIQRLLTHPGHNAALQQFSLQLDVDTLAIVDQAIADLTPPSTGGGGGVIA